MVEVYFLFTFSVDTYMLVRGLDLYLFAILFWILSRL